jgi:hypothetical protein
METDRSATNCRVIDNLLDQIKHLKARRDHLRNVSMANEYHLQGCLFPVHSGFSPSKMNEIDAVLTDAVKQRPANLKPEDMLNMHLTDEGIFSLCREPSSVKMAQLLLGTPDISVFTSRILCKLPQTGYEIPWHQDSNYWPLIPPHKDCVHPTVASLWLAIDDVRLDNGKMEVLPFSVQPNSKGRNVTECMLDAGGDTSGFDNFNLSVDPGKLNVEGSRPVLLRRGQASWHSAWTIHRSDPNRSSTRRMAWIVRYCPTGTKVQPGIRGSFGADYKFVPVAGSGAETTLPEPSRERYAPCFGNSAALKK